MRASGRSDHPRVALIAADQESSLGSSLTIGWSGSTLAMGSVTME